MMVSAEHLIIVTLMMVYVTFIKKERSIMMNQDWLQKVITCKRKGMAAMMEDFIYETLAVISTTILFFCIFFYQIADFCVGKPARIVFTVFGILLLILAILGMGAKERRIANKRKNRRLEHE